MAQNQPYQSNWAGALQNNAAPLQPQNQNGPQNFMSAPNIPWNNQPATDSYLFIAPVQSEEAVDNYPVARGVTAILINYSKGIFWKKRQTNDGLGYETVKHYFFAEDDFNRMRAQQKEQANTQPDKNEEFENLRSEVLRLRRDFDDLMK